MPAASSLQIAPEIQALLGRLRRRVRLWVLADTLLGILGWAALTFWVFLSLDYGPVMLWASELPVSLRAWLLAAVLIGYLVLLYRRWLRRALVPLPDESLALIVERRYPQFDESLITSVQLVPRAEPVFSQPMLSATQALARAQLPSVRLGRTLVWRPLLLQLVGVFLLWMPIIALDVLRPEMVQLGLRRLYALSDELWPRQASIDLVGIQVQHRSMRTGEQVWSEIINFRDGEVKVARGAYVMLQVRAALQAERVPDTCRIVYRTEDGSRGRVAMRRDGSPRGSFQYYSYDDKPFRGILGNIRFDVIGADHRLRNYTIRAVDAPAVVQTELECVFPQYLVDETEGLWLPRRIPYRSSGVTLPRGTRVVVHMKTNKPFIKVEIASPGTQQLYQVDGHDRFPTEFQYEIPHLAGNVVLEVGLRDIDNVLSDVPHRIVLSAVDDKPPELDLSVRGIGSAVTPQVIIPVEGTIVDDYRIAEAWFEYQVEQQPAQQEPIEVGPDGSISAGLDFRQLRARSVPVALQPGQKLFVTVKASDRCTLGTGPNVSQTERLELEVVTPEELLIRLDRRELAERRRLEHVLDELTQTRDALIRVQNEILGITPALDPGERTPSQDASSTAPEQGQGRLDLRAIRVQQAIRQCQKSASEVLDIAQVLYAIREELINNRIDAEDRKSRLKELVADPLQKIGRERFPSWEQSLVQLEKSIHLEQDAAQNADLAINSANQLLAELNQVLEAMLDIESYNELIEIVRNLIKEQERILDETKNARKQEALELLK